MLKKEPGYQFTIFNQIADNKKRATADEIAKIEQEYADKIACKQSDIQALYDFDPDDMDAETRREIRDEKNELKDLESERDEKIAKLLAQQKTK